MKVAKKCEESGENCPDYSPLITRANRVTGQLQGIKRMIEEERYCPEILDQISAAKKALSSLYSSMMQSHLEVCVQKAFRSDSERERKLKIKELVELMRKA